MLTVMVVFILIHPSEVNALLKGGKAAKGRLGTKMMLLNGNHRRVISDA